MTENEQKLYLLISNQIKRELTTAISYQAIAATRTGMTETPFISFCEKEAQDEFKHAQTLTNIIFQYCPTPDKYYKVLELDIDIESIKCENTCALIRKFAMAELDDVLNYTEMSGIAEDLGYLKLKVLFEEMGAEEDNHFDELNRMINNSLKRTTE